MYISSLHYLAFTLWHELVVNLPCVCFCLAFVVSIFMERLTSGSVVTLSPDWTLFFPCVIEIFRVNDQKKFQCNVKALLTPLYSKSLSGMYFFFFYQNLKLMWNSCIWGAFLKLAKNIARGCFLLILTLYHFIRTINQIRE